MINFEDLRINTGDPLDKDKWNGMLDWVVENPFNLDEQKLELTNAASDLKVEVEANASYGMIGTSGNAPLAINPGRGNVGIGTTSPAGALQIINQNQNGNGDTLILGPTNQANLRLGYFSTYSWIQAHGSRPLAINPVGNNVGIGTTNPLAKLEVNGTFKADYYTYSGNAAHRLIHFQRYNNLGDNVSRNTGYSASQWNAAIIGFVAASGDIQENDAGRIIEMRMTRSNNIWHINADFRTHKNHENWSVDVMFVRLEISSRSGM